MALRELYELKCKEVDLTNLELNSYKERVEGIKEKNHKFVESSVRAL